MSIEGTRSYPGEGANPSQILLLADEYRTAAESLRLVGRRGAPLSSAPYRFLAIQAIELYLNALLLNSGYPAKGLRGLHHDLAKRTQLAVGAKLVLRKRTACHLENLSLTREYLVIRYDPAHPAGSQLNRLSATLTEVAEKVKLLVL